MRKILFTTIFMSILLYSCSERLDVNDSHSRILRFEISKNQTTKVINNSFESGDAVGIFVTEYVSDTPKSLQLSGNYVNNERAQFNGSNWVTSNTLYWPDGKCDAIAYYPYISTLNSITKEPFSIQTDQSVGIGTSDFLWAKTSAQKYDSNNPDAAVNLNFNHMMSKVVLKLKKGSEYIGDWPTDAKFYIHSTIPDATVDLTTGCVTKDNYATSKRITCMKLTDSTYTAVLVPQKISSHSPLIEMVSKGVSYLAEGEFNYKPGIVHTFTITLNTSTESIRVDIGGEIEGWE